MALETTRGSVQLLLRCTMQVAAPAGPTTPAGSVIQRQYTHTLSLSSTAYAPYVTFPNFSCALVVGPCEWYSLETAALLSTPFQAWVLLCWCAITASSSRRCCRYCEWHGCSCVRAGSIGRDGPPGSAVNTLVALNLSKNELKGVVGGVQFGAFAGLTALHLQENELEGPIPGSIAALAELVTLELWSNKFSGPIPGWVGSLHQLRDLNLYENALSGVRVSAVARLALYALLAVAVAVFLTTHPPPY